jgi:competence protein ComEC
MSRWSNPRPAPLAPAALGLTAGIAASEWVGGLPPWAVWVLAAAPLAIAVPLLVGTRWVIMTPLGIRTTVAAAFAALGIARHQAACSLPPDHVGRLAGAQPTLTRLLVRVVAPPRRVKSERLNPFLSLDPPPRTRLIAEALKLRTEADPVRVRGLIRVRVEAEHVDARPGDVLELTGWLYRPRGPQNPGEVDWAQHARLQHIHAALAVESPVHVRRVESPRTGLVRWLDALRGLARAALLEPYAGTGQEEQRSMLDALVLGQRSTVEREVDEAFRRTGSVHFLSVSGFHVGVLAAAAFWLGRVLSHLPGLARVVRQDGVASLVAAAAIVGYALLAEPNAPILRAAVMGLLWCAALAMHRPLCPGNWLSLSALAILIWDPLQLLRVGFQLSFLQVWALFAVLPAAFRACSVALDYQRYVTGRGDLAAHLRPEPATLGAISLRWFGRRGGQLLAACLCAWLMATPIVMLRFEQFYPWAALQSALLTLPVTVVVVFGFAGLLVSALLPGAGPSASAGVHVLADGLLRLVDGLARVPLTAVNAPAPPAWLVGVTYLAIVVCVWRLGKWSRQLDEALAAKRSREALFSIPERRDIRRRALLAAAPLVGLAAGWAGWKVWDAVAAGPPRGVQLHVLSVGNGGACLATTGTGAAALFDVGTNYNSDAGATVADALRVLRVKRLALITVSHAGFTRYSGLPTLLCRTTAGGLGLTPYFTVGGAAGRGADRLLAMLPAGVPRLTLRQGDRLKLGEAELEVLWPPYGLSDSWKPGDTSLVAKFSVQGLSVLLCGDIQRDAIRELLVDHAADRIDLRSHVLIAPHHGSVTAANSAAFYRTVSPTLVVASSGEPREKLEAMVRVVLGPDRPVLNTDEVGMVLIVIRDGALEVQTPLARPARPPHRLKPAPFP